MPIAIACACGRSLRVKDELAGRKVRCPKCATVVPVPVPIVEKDAEQDVLNLLLEDDTPGKHETQLATKETITRVEEHVSQAAPAPRLQPPQLPKLPPAVPKRRSSGREKRSRRSGPPVMVNPEMVGGVFMMVGAVVWFGLGLLAGVIFFYPPILFVLGIGALIRGATGKR